MATSPTTEVGTGVHAVHVLVVEDERRLALLLRRILTEERHNVDVAFDGVGGLKDYLSDKTALDVKASFGFHPNAASKSQILTFTVGFSFLF